MEPLIQLRTRNFEPTPDFESMGETNKQEQRIPLRKKTGSRQATPKSDSTHGQAHPQDLECTGYTMQHNTIENCGFLEREQLRWNSDSESANTTEKLSPAGPSLRTRGCGSTLTHSARSSGFALRPMTDGRGESAPHCKQSPSLRSALSLSLRRDGGEADRGNAHNVAAFQPRVSVGIRGTWRFHRTLRESLDLPKPYWRTKLKDAATLIQNAYRAHLARACRDSHREEAVNQRRNTNVKAMTSNLHGLIGGNRFRKQVPVRAPCARSPGGGNTVCLACSAPPHAPRNPPLKT